ncbi:MAG: tetratricopeptide repeat protein [Acidobacteriota bacterium]|nr:tetratricopeptide repeat protein [Acidobacteriota bacterium]
MLAIVAATLALIALGDAWWRDRPLTRNPPASRIGAPVRRAFLLVRPFQDLSPAPGLSYVSDGFTEALRVQLGRMYPQALGVIGPTTARAYRGTAAPIGQIGRDLGVDWVLEGSVRVNGPRALVTAALVQVRGTRTLWSDRFERDRTDLAAMQRDVAQEVSRVVAARLVPRPNLALAHLATGSGPAYDACLRGEVARSGGTPDDLARAAEAFDEATRDDPDYAQAWVGLAETHLARRARLLDAPASALDRAGQAARRAVALDPSLSGAHAALGEVLALTDPHDPKAASELRRAINLDPSNVQARARDARLLMALGRTGEALEQLGRAMAFDPRAAGLPAAQGWAWYGSGDDERAAAAFEAALTLDPAYAFAYYGRGRIAERHARFDAAIADFTRASTIAPDDAVYLGALGDACAKTGRIEAARAALRALQALAMTRYVAPADIRDLANGIGRAEALATAQRARPMVH